MLERENEMEKDNPDNPEIQNTPLLPANITIRDIAKQCNVSIATVSRVLNTPHLVRADTRRHVERVIRRTGYTYNSMAGALAKRKNPILGIIVPTTSDVSFQNTLSSLQKTALKKGFSVILGSSYYNAKTEARLLQRFREMRISAVGMLSYSLGQEEALAAIQQSGIPCLVLWDTIENPELNYIGFDNHEAAYKAVSYLMDLGHKRIAFLVGPHDKTHSAYVRVNGYKKAFADAGLAYDPNWIVVVEDSHSVEIGRLGTLHALNMQPRPTALLMAGDALAMGALFAVQQLGLSVPQDVSIMGMDDADFAAHTTPALTTLRIPSKRMGILAAQFFADVMASTQGELWHKNLVTTIVERQSCACPPD